MKSVVISERTGITLFFILNLAVALVVILGSELDKARAAAKVNCGVCATATLEK